MTPTTVRLFSTAAILSGISTISLAQTVAPAAIYSEALPTTAGSFLSPANLGGIDASINFDDFGRAYLSPDGSSWVIVADVRGSTSSNDNILIQGSGFSGNVIAREGTQAPWGVVLGEEIGSFSNKLGVNNSGEVVFGTNTSGGPSNLDEIIVVYVDGSYDRTAVIEGQQVPGEPVGSTFSGGFGANLDVGSITESGDVGYRGNPFPGGGDGVFLGNSQLARADLTVPTGNGNTESYDFFDGDIFAPLWFSADGSSFIATGDINGPAAFDEVTVVDNQIVIQQGMMISGVDQPVNGAASGTFMASNGDWLASGTTRSADGTEFGQFVLYNDTLLAQDGDAIAPGSPESWATPTSTSASTFTGYVTNTLGDIILYGVTDSLDPLANEVAVLNDLGVFLREGDQIDLDNNGVLDDDAFLGTFSGQSAALTDAGLFYFNATLRTALGDSLGEAFLVYDVTTATFEVIPEPGVAVMMSALGGLLLRRRRRLA